MRKTAKNHAPRARENVADANTTQQMGLMTQAEYARHAGRDRSTINRHAKSGKIPIDSAGLILVAEADAILGVVHGIAAWRCVIEGQELVITPGLERSGDVAYLDDFKASLSHRNKIFAYEIQRLKRYAPHLTRAAREGGEALVAALLEKMVRRLTDGLNRQLDEMDDELSTDGLVVKNG